MVTPACFSVILAHAHHVPRLSLTHATVDNSLHRLDVALPKPGHVVRCVEELSLVTSTPAKMLAILENVNHVLDSLFRHVVVGTPLSLENVPTQSGIVIRCVINDTDVGTIHARKCVTVENVVNVRKVAFAHVLVEKRFILFPAHKTSQLVVIPVEKSWLVECTFVLNAAIKEHALLAFSFG